MSDLQMHCWKAYPEDIAVLKALKKAKAFRTESDRVREGLRALAREKGVAI